MSSPSGSDPQPHVRPKVRRNAVSEGEATEKRTQTTEAVATDKPAGILRPPKYGTAATQRVASQQAAILKNKKNDTSPDISASPSLPRAAVRDVVVERPRTSKKKRGAAIQTNSTPSATAASSTAIEGYTPMSSTTKSTTQSTPNVPPSFTMSDTNHTTETTPCESSDSNKEAIILNSLADLLETTGVISLPSPDNNNLQDAAVVEANLEFSVVSPEAYQQLQQDNCDAQYAVMMGQRPRSFLENIGDKENAVTEDASPTRTDNDEADSDLDDRPEEDDMDPEDAGDDEDSSNWMDDYFTNDGSDEEDDDTPREARAFLTLWTALAQWVTPQAVEYVQALRSSDIKEELPIQSAVDRTDIGASRCAGLMALIQMHFRLALQELGLPLEDRRRTERLVGNLLRTFDYGRPSPKLDVAHAKAMATILLQTVVYDPRGNLADDKLDPAVGAKSMPSVPPSCQALGVTADEFRYLTVSAVTNLATPSI